MHGAGVLYEAAATRSSYRSIIIMNPSHQGHTALCNFSINIARQVAAATGSPPQARLSNVLACRLHSVLTR